MYTYIYIDRMYLSLLIIKVKNLLVKYLYTYVVDIVSLLTYSFVKYIHNNKSNKIYYKVAEKIKKYRKKKVTYIKYFRFMI